MTIPQLEKSFKAIWKSMDDFKPDEGTLLKLKLVHYKNDMFEAYLDELKPKKKRFPKKGRGGATTRVAQPPEEDNLAEDDTPQPQPQRPTYRGRGRGRGNTRA